jgi:hypothetical protein
VYVSAPAFGRAEMNTLVILAFVSGIFSVYSIQTSEPSVLWFHILFQNLLLILLAVNAWLDDQRIKWLEDSFEIIDEDEEE